MVKLWQNMLISIKLPIAVTEDYVGAMFMVGNVFANSHAKQEDTSYKYANEYEEDGIDKIVFVNSA